MHPNGEELVVCLARKITLHQELGHGAAKVTLKRYEAFINPRGVWHTADVRAEATALLITAGEGATRSQRAQTCLCPTCAQRKRAT
jgi:hypothetical protein